MVKTEFHLYSIPDTAPIARLRLPLVAPEYKQKDRLTRRDFVRLSVLAAGASLLAACAGEPSPTPPPTIPSRNQTEPPKPPEPTRQPTENATRNLFEELDKLLKTPVNSFIDSARGLYSGAASYRLVDCDVPLVDPIVEFTPQSNVGDASLHDTSYNPRTNPNVIIFTPPQEATREFPLIWVATEPEMQTIQFPGYADLGNGVRIPKLPIRFLKDKEYFLFLRPSIHVGKNSDPRFIRFALVKEAAALALTLEFFRQTINTARALNIPTKIQAAVKGQGVKEIDAIPTMLLMLLSQGERIKALIDIGSYALAIRAFEHDLNMTGHLQNIYRGFSFGKISSYDFGVTPAGITKNTFQWVVSNPESQGFHHVGDMNKLP